MANRNRDCRAGFSLLELIIVLMVMISLLAIAWPNLQRPLRRQPLGEAAELLRTAIDESRYKAITEGHPQFVLLRQGSKEIQSGSFESFASQSDATGLGDARLPVQRIALPRISMTPMRRQCDDGACPTQCKSLKYAGRSSLLLKTKTSSR